MGLLMPDPTLCLRCAGSLLPLVGSHFGDQAEKPRRSIAAHGRLARRAWRSSYPQEGGEYLYQCADCQSWWGHGVWTCVPEEDLVRHAVVSLEAWVAEQPFGEVES
jgi:hypothetical protein